MATNVVDGDGDRTVGGLPAEVVADLLDHPRRRHALSVLDERGEPMCLEDLAVVIRAREDDRDPEDIDETTARDVRDELFERHLPKLTATDVVSYDSKMGTVELTRPAVVGVTADEETESE